MRALLYSDWCAVRTNLRSYVIVSLLVASVVSVSGALGENSALGASVYAQQSIVTMVSAMLTMMCIFGLFGSDERVGWEAARLALPFLRRDVVRARYGFLMCLSVGMVVLGAIAGTTVGAVASWMAFGTPALSLSAETLWLCAGTLLIVVFFASVEMPLFFWLGASRARVFFSLPLLLIPLLNIEPIGRAAGIAWERLVGMAAPEVLCGIATVIVGLTFAGSLLLAQRLYETRDF